MRVFAALALALALAGCATSPTPNFYTLALVAGSVQHPALRSIELRRIGLAGYLDRPDIVRSAAHYRLELAANDRWGEPLGGMLARVLSEDLLQRLPGVAVYDETGAISAAPDRVVEMDIQRFDAGADGAIVLLAEVAVRGEGASATFGAHTVRLSARPGGPGTAAQVAAMSAVLGQLADAVVGMLAG
jgi:uncharacterized lipoprotein YmbA